MSEAQLEEVRSRAQSLLCSSPLQAQDLKLLVQTMAGHPLPLAQKYQHLQVEAMLRDNTVTQSRQEALDSLGRLVKAFSILEKYGCNLTTPTRPKYWRSVKHNNPVFRTTVDAIKGGRQVLSLYGYINQQVDGLSFPESVLEPDVEMVAAVTLEVMSLRAEVDMLIKGSHPHPEFFKDAVPPLVWQEDPGSDSVATQPSKDPQVRGGQPQVSPAPPVPPKPPSPKAPTVGECNLCGGAATLLCPACELRPFCDPCDDLFHRHPSRISHKRDKITKEKTESCSICGLSSLCIRCTTCAQSLCPKCDSIYHSHPDRKGHSRVGTTPAKTSSLSLSPWECGHCTTVNETRAVLCKTCERPRLATTAPSLPDESNANPPSHTTEWECKSCTVVNLGSSVLCQVCERPRLATRPAAIPAFSVPVSVADATQWTCQYCTFANATVSALCEMCNLPRKDPTPAPPPQTKDAPQKPAKPQPKPRTDPQLRRQRLMKEDGLKLIQQIRDAERQGFTPEEVYAAVCVSGSSNTNPCEWLTSELPHLLDEICAMAASVQSSYKPGDGRTEGSAETSGQADPGVAGEGVKLSRAEAKLAWLAARGDTEKAVRQLLRDRQEKMRELRSLGFLDVPQCQEALRQSGGEVKGALSLLQRPLLEPFHQRIWTEQLEPHIDPADPDKQRMCRRLLALYELPSWGRCEMVLSLLQEPGDVSYSLEDVVQAVKEFQDKDFIRRLLRNECPCCLSLFPRSKMQSLTSCQCSVCHECFGQHFTIAIRDKHIRDMVCPVCGGPDINDPQQLDSYFSTLDIQLRDCLEPDVYTLFHRKLTEHALMKDPKFLWCCHCTSGFIYDGNQLKVTCPSCRRSFCAQCKKPWEAQHQDVTCAQFQQWKRENDPEYQRQGLAGYLRDNGITCPNCRFSYALARGGCMHFSCSQCRYQFCSGCNNPYHTTACKTPQCKLTGLHAHHPRDCLFYLRDWDPPRLQALLQRSGVEFNIDPPLGAQTDACSVMEQKEDLTDSPCGLQTQPGQAGLCEKHYKEYLVSLINTHSLDPAPLYDAQELAVACDRYQVERHRREEEDEPALNQRLLRKLMEVPLGEKVPRNK